MESEEGENSSSTPPSRGRPSLKSKLLVRSHAMREETSPPREPSPYRHNQQLYSPQHPSQQQQQQNSQQQQHYPPAQQQQQQYSSPQQQQMQSPCIQLIPSPSSTPPPTREVSSSPSAGFMSTPSPQCLSPTATLVPSPHSRCSPNLSASADNVSPYDRRQPDHLQEGNGSKFVTSSPKFSNKTNVLRQSDSSKPASHSFKRKFTCDCQSQNCPRCAKNHERTINNNNPSNVNNNNASTGSPNTLTVSRTSSRGKLRQQSSSQGSFESSSMSPCLSRDSSLEQYTDTTGVDLELFIPETLNRNAKDRAFLLRVEQELVNLAKDRCRTHFKFPPMSSYQRMLVHRCAAYFGMDHNIEPTGKSVVVNKTRCTRIPGVEFKDHLKEDIVFCEEPRRSILKRDSNSIEDYSFKSPDRSFSLESRRSKSFEEREEEYEKVRRRIFNNREVDKWWFLWQMQDGSSEDFGWSEVPWSSTESDCSSRYRLQPPDIHRRHMGKLIKGHSEEPGETARPCVAKSYSFGGYGGNVSVLTRGDSVMSTHSAGPRLLTKQDSGASSVSWRLSPSSSGYKSQSQMSESVTPSPTSTASAHARQDSNGGGEDGDEGEEQEQQDERRQERRQDNHVVWAVTDVQNVPRGSFIINPQTGRRLKNEDGSVYRFDPADIPPRIWQLLGRGASATAPPQSPRRPPPLQESQQAAKETFAQSPKKTARSVRSSPPAALKSQFTNSSTSPIMPFSPTLVASSGSQTRSFSYVTTESVSTSPQHHQQQQQQQHFSGYSSTYSAPATADTTTVYQQPYIVYTAPYGVHLQQQYETRMDLTTGAPEIIAAYTYIGDGPGQPQVPAMAYQQAPPAFWNPPVFYGGNAAPNAPPQRYPSQTAYMPTAYPANYMQPPAAQQHQAAPDYVPVYQNQQQQQQMPTVFYQPQPAAHSPVVYPAQQPQQMVFPVYQPSPAAYPPSAPQMPAYPQGSQTPNGCPASAQGQLLAGPPVAADSQPMAHLTQSMQQLGLGGNIQPQAFSNPKGMHHPQYDCRMRSPAVGPKNKQFCKNIMLGSSQSSTGTNSPAATVIANYGPPAANPPMMYRPAETPPNQFAFPPNFSMPPVMYKPIGNVRASTGTPATSRSSRSPTPAMEVPFFERRMSMPPPNVYQGIPYVATGPDSRLVVGRGPPNAYRQGVPQSGQPAGQCFVPGTDNRSRKNRKTKSNRQFGLPPNGR